MSKYNRKKCTKRVRKVHYRQFRQTVETHYNDELELVQKLYPIFASDTYLRNYERQEQFMREHGYNALQRSYAHSQARQAIIQKLRVDPERYG